MRLARLLVALLPSDCEVAGLRALLLLNESRVTARRRDGVVVLLRDQDRSMWDAEMIVEGQAIVRDCIRREHPGPYQLQAAIQAVHGNARRFEQTDSRQIVSLYDHLYELAPTPVVALNRAVALAEIDGPHAALEAIDGIGAVLDGYWSLHAARASMLRRLGRSSEAVRAYERAQQLSPGSAGREFFERQINELRDT